MPKIYAREVPASHFNFYDYMDDDFCEAYDVVVHSFNATCLNWYSMKEYERAVDRVIEELDADVDNLRDFIETCFCACTPTGRTFTDDDINNIVEIIRYYDSIESLCELKSIITGKPYKVYSLVGSCQGDWAQCIAPADIDQDILDYIAACLFGTGTEWEITEEPIESVDDFDTTETFIEYTAKWRDEDIKSWVLECAGYPNDGSTEVALLRLTGRHYEYDYEEV